ncbi:MAG: hypothetical protein HY702_03250 [Gemmatimonadetes bacterium]|nr:hypothetical protein [Gemmatimonadota bacterium]
MDPEVLHLLRWIVPAAGSSLPASLRALERIVVEEAAAAVRDPVVQEHAVAYHLEKRPDGEQDAGGQAALVIGIVAPPEPEAVLTAAVARHLRSESFRQRLEPPDVLLHPVAAEYRRGLREVTDVALDLHCGVERQLRAHQCALLRVGCGALEPRFGLQAHLAEHSAAYVRLAGLAGAPQDLWAHEAFWMRLYTPGPGAHLGRPIDWLWKIVLGVIPRRWSDPVAVAHQVGIECA